MAAWCEAKYVRVVASGKLWFQPTPVGKRAEIYVYETAFKEKKYNKLYYDQFMLRVVGGQNGIGVRTDLGGSSTTYNGRRSLCIDPDVRGSPRLPTLVTNRLMMC